MAAQVGRGGDFAFLLVVCIFKGVITVWPHRQLGLRSIDGI